MVVDLVSKFSLLFIYLSSFFLSFVFAYLLKIVLLQRLHNIKANLLRKGKKPLKVRAIEQILKTTTFLWMLLWLIESLFPDRVTG